jgi:uncharacterized protein (DUF4415 family)
MVKAPRYGVPDEENPEWTEEDFARARPFKNVFPEQFASWQNKRIGRPPSSNPKVHISFRLASDLVDGIKATGEGYNARVEKVLRNALERGALNEPSPRVRALKDILVKFGDIGDVTLKVLAVYRREGATRKELLDHVTREYEIAVRPDQLGDALQRHRRAGRVERREGRWFPAGSA